jgi:hypothetical protein
VRIGGFDYPQFDPDADSTEDRSIKSKFINKSKGTQLKDELSVNTFQKFKAEWSTYYLLTTLPQIKRELIDQQSSSW